MICKDLQKGGKRIASCHFQQPTQILHTALHREYNQGFEIEAKV